MPHDGNTSLLLRERNDAEEFNLPFSLRDKFGFLLEHESKARFFSRVWRIHPPHSDEFRLIKHAYKTAKEDHRLQVRTTGERYFEHVRAVPSIMIVGLGVKSAWKIIGGLKHDTIEDCDVDQDYLAWQYGAKAANLVWWVSKPPRQSGQSDADYERACHDKLRDALEPLFS